MVRVRVVLIPENNFKVMFADLFQGSDVHIDCYAAE